MKHLLAATALFPAILLHAQQGPSPSAAPLPDINADITALNDHFSGLVTFRIDRHDRLVVDYFDNGTRYREDVTYMEFLNADAVVFNSEENTVMVRCSEEKQPDGQELGKCIDKEVTKTGAISRTGRMNLPVPPGDAEGSKAIALLGGLLRDAQLVQRSMADETNPGRKRKN